MSRGVRGLARTRPALARRLESLSERDQLAAVLGEIFTSEGPPALVTVLASVLEDYERCRDPVASRILLATMSLLERQQDPAMVRSLVGEARSRELRRLTHFFESPPPLLMAEVQRAQVLRGKDGKPLSLGERKSLARNPGRFQLDRLLSDPSPDVVRNLLSSPRLTEMDVMRIASRRPAVPAVLREVACSSRWVTRYRIRLALVQNPYLEPALGVKLAALLMEQDRRMIAADHTLHPRIREFCDRSMRDGQDAALVSDIDESCESGIEEDVKKQDS
jgi:hypothetical protein